MSSKALHRKLFQKPSCLDGIHRHRLGVVPEVIKNQVGGKSSISAVMDSGIRSDRVLLQLRSIAQDDKKALKLCGPKDLHLAQGNDTRLVLKVLLQDDVGDGFGDLPLTENNLNLDDAKSIR